MLGRLLKRLFTPITIMLVPHEHTRPVRFRVPIAFLICIAFLSVFGAVYVYDTTSTAIQYRSTKDKLDYYTGQFNDLKSTISALRMAEVEFARLFSNDSKEAVLENLDTSDAGSIDMEVLKRQIRKTIDSVGEIKDYLSEQRDIYMATPMGWPVEGWLSSRYGRRKHPIKGTWDYHTGVDISSNPNKPIKATADGVVSFSGWSGANGRLVAIEHGFGFSTYYGHNKKNAVKVGDVVKRGDVVAYIGSTGSSTGPHVHYEISKDGKSVNPRKYLEEAKK